MLDKLFLSVILTIGLSLFYSNEEASAQVPDIVFETTNASAQSFSDHDFILNINNMTKNNEICKSGGDCLIEIIEFHDSGHPTGGVSLPTPGIQSMYSGVDIRIHDPIYKNMSGLEREYQERWRIWANCDIAEIKDTIFICGKNDYDKITISNDLQGIEVPLPLISGAYDPELNVVTFAANFK